MQAIGEVIEAFLRNSRWKQKMIGIRIESEWEQIVGKTIARYTRNVAIKNGILFVATDVAPLKQELQLNKEALLQRINDHFKEVVVHKLIIH